MALPNNPSRGQIFGEFGSNTASSGGFSSDQSLKKMYSEIFGAGSYSRDAFGGYGRPDVSWVSDDSTSDSIDVTISVTRNNLDAKVRIKYDTDLAFTSPSYTPTQTYTTDGNKTITISGLAGNTTYYYIVEYWNAFNDASASDYDELSVETIDTVQPTLTAPVLLNTITYSIGDHTLEWNTSGDEPTSFQFEYRVDGGSWSSVNSFSEGSNWGTTTDPKDADVTTGQLPNPGELYEFRVRGTRSGYNSSPWSNVEGYQH